ncbi:MAG: methyltransferase domain-containing protein [Cellvibrionales bacterium]|nr:methyltransferase domain-containing protein [Cellvibrionales bacterium]
MPHSADRPRPETPPPAAVSGAATVDNALEDWFAATVGQRMLKSEMDLIDAQFRRTPPGRTMLQISPLSAALLGTRSRHCLKIAVLPGMPAAPGAGGDYPRLIAMPLALPLAAGAVDVLLLHHSLEFAGDPQEVLREAVRTLAPHGQMLIICFNPRSLLHWCRRTPRPLHRLSAVQVSGWLKLLNCRVRSPAFGWYGFAGLDAWLTRQRLPGGGFYMLHAVKHVAGWVGPSALKVAPRRVRLPLATAASRLGGPGG